MCVRERERERKDIVLNNCFLFFIVIFLIAICIAKKYTDDHEWISIEDGVGTIGITDYAQKVLLFNPFFEKKGCIDYDRMKRKDKSGRNIYIYARDKFILTLVSYSFF